MKRGDRLSRSKYRLKRMAVSIRHVVTTDTDRRIYRAIEILLTSGANDTTTGKKLKRKM